MKRNILFSMAILLFSGMALTHSQTQPLPSPTVLIQPQNTTLNSDERAFVEYVKAGSEKNFLEILNKFKNPKFPSNKFMESVSETYKRRPWLEPFMIPGQAMKPSIYFEIAEGSELKKKERYLNKIILLPDDCVKGLIVGSKPVPVKEEAYLYLLELYRDTQQKEKLCEVSDEILKEFLNSEYQVTKFGEYGLSHPEALLVKFKACPLSLEEKIQILKEVLEKYGTKRYTEHGGSSQQYGAVALAYIREMSRAKTFTNTKTFSLIKALLKNKTIPRTMGSGLHFILSL